MANPMGGTALPDCSAEVREALAAGRAVVALESTIISHGMPYPQNVATALQVEGEVRAHGAVPATMAVVSPASGLRPLAMAKAMASGRATTPTVRPAPTSRQVVWRQQSSRRG